MGYCRKLDRSKLKINCFSSYFIYIYYEKFSLCGHPTSTDVIRKRYFANHEDANHQKARTMSPKKKKKKKCVKKNTKNKLKKIPYQTQEYLM